MVDSQHPNEKELPNRLGTISYKKEEDGITRTVFHYQIPFPPDKEAVILAQYNIPKSARLSFYQNLAFCIQRHVSVCDYLNKSNVSSILSFSKVEQQRDDSGISNIYMETEQVWPITERLLTGSISAVTLIEIFSRLALILRFTDSSTKEPVGVVHRGFDLNEVFINAENKILLGGFYYADCPGMEPPPDYLPMKPANIPRKFLLGEKGDQGTDIQALTTVAWNLFSGLPHDTPLQSNRFVFPEFASEDILAALMIGFSGDEAYCNAFRRKFMEARKLLTKADASPILIPIRSAKSKTFQVEYV